jgi:ABC-type Na+ efflux pump permease subunit
MRVRTSLALLTERRTGVYVVIDATVLFVAVVTGFSGSGTAHEFYPVLFFLPAFAIALPMMADCVAVERRAGTLDLVLTSPGSAHYFERHILSVALLLIAQGWLTLAIPWLLVERFPVSGPAIQIVVVTLFLSAAALNWAVRMRSAGGAVVLTCLTCIVFAPWFFSNPIRPIDVQHGPMSFADYLEFLRRNLILAAAAAVLYAYARRRLARPETLIT